MKLRKDKTKFNSSFHHHNSFGIYNYLKSKGYHGDKGKEITEAYLFSKDFKGDDDKSKCKFIQNRFQDFIKFVNSLKANKI